MTVTDIKTPELDKQNALIKSGKPRTVQEFIDWLQENGMAIMVRCRPQYDGDYECVHGSFGRYCGRCANTGFRGERSDWERLMAEHFGIDLNKIESERREILAALSRGAS